MDINIEDILKIDYYRENKKRIKFIIDGEGKEQIKKALNTNIKKNKNNEDIIFIIFIFFNILLMLFFVVTLILMAISIVICNLILR